MENSKKVLVACIIIVVAGSYLPAFLTTKTLDDKPIVKTAAPSTIPVIIGATYEIDYTVDKNNPFEKKRIYTVIVLDIKSGYIKHCTNI